MKTSSKTPSKARPGATYTSLAALLLVTPGLLASCKKVEGDTAAPISNTDGATDDGMSDEDRERAKIAKEAAEKKAMLEALPPLPGIKAPAPVEFPDPVVFRLDNGLEIIVLEDHEVPLVEVSLEIRAGEIYAPTDKPTLAAMTASLLGEGSVKRKKAVIDEQVDRTGGSMSSSAGSNLASMSASMLSRDLDLALGLIAEQTLTPAFPEDALNKLKDETKQGTKAAKGDPQALIGAMAGRVIYGEGSGYGRGFPTEPQIEAVTRDDVVAFHARHYVPNNAMVVVAGDVDPEAVRKAVQKHLGKWKAGDKVEVPVSELPPPDKPVVHIIGRRASAQSTIAVVVPAPRIGEPGWLETEVAQKILAGGTLSTRLNQVLREQLGLTYGAYARYSYGYDGGMFYAGGGTKRKTADQFAAALIDLVFDVGETPIPEKDLDRTKAFVSGRFALEAEGVNVAASRTIRSRLYGLPDDFWSNYRGDIAKMTPDALHQHASSMLDRNRMQIIAVGKTSDLEKQLGKYGEIRVYDKDLNRVK